MKSEIEGDPTMESKLEETNGKEENNGSSRLTSCCSEGEIKSESEMKSGRGMKSGSGMKIESEVDPTMEWKLDETNGKGEKNGRSLLTSCCSES